MSPRCRQHLHMYDEVYAALVGTSCRNTRTNAIVQLLHVYNKLCWSVKIESTFPVCMCFRYSAIFSQFIIPHITTICLPSQTQLVNEQFCNSKITVCGTNEMIMYPLELPRIVDKLSENAQMRSI